MGPEDEVKFEGAEEFKAPNDQEAQSMSEKELKESKEAVFLAELRQKMLGENPTPEQVQEFEKRPGGKLLAIAERMVKFDYIKEKYPELKGLLVGGTYIAYDQSYIVLDERHALKPGFDIHADGNVVLRGPLDGGDDFPIYTPDGRAPKRVAFNLLDRDLSSTIRHDLGPNIVKIIELLDVYTTSTEELVDKIKTEEDVRPIADILRKNKGFLGKDMQSGYYYPSEEIKALRNLPESLGGPRGNP